MDGRRVGWEGYEMEGTLVERDMGLGGLIGGYGFGRGYRIGRDIGLEGILDWKGYRVGRDIVLGEIDSRKDIGPDGSHRRYGSRPFF